VRRRTLLLGGAAALGLAPLNAMAQQPARGYRVGLLLPMAGIKAEPYLAAVRERLRAHGLVDGRNLHMEIRYGNAPMEARELAALKPDAMFAWTTALATASHAAAKDVPLVFAWVSDPVNTGLVQSYARPGGSVTGVANRNTELVQKRVELLRELMPSAARVALIAGVFDAPLRAALIHTQATADRLHLKLMPMEAGLEWKRAFERARAGGADAILVLTPFDIFGMGFVAAEVVGYSIERRVPTLFSDVESVELGGLLSYGSDPLADVRQAADLLARVLKGEKPSAMPVELASRFRLAVNLKTAKVLGVSVPRSILLRADKVIE
jgi:putative ABC transport system substrate-binding protein